MKAIIIAAGRGKRMQSLTSTAPKPMLLVAGKPLIEHIISSLPDQVDELFIIIGYLGDQIKNFCGDNFYGRSVTYIEQERPLIGIVKYSDGTVEVDDLVGFRPSSEYEFVIDGERLYRVLSNFITIKYEYQGDEEEYNPSWA